MSKRRTGNLLSNSLLVVNSDGTVSRRSYSIRSDGSLRVGGLCEESTGRSNRTKKPLMRTGKQVTNMSTSLPSLPSGSKRRRKGPKTPSKFWKSVQVDPRTGKIINYESVLSAKTTDQGHEKKVSSCDINKHKPVDGKSSVSKQKNITERKHVSTNTILNNPSDKKVLESHSNRVVVNMSRVAVDKVKQTANTIHDVSCDAENTNQTTPRYYSKSLSVPNPVLTKGIKPKYGYARDLFGRVQERDIIQDDSVVNPYNCADLFDSEDDNTSMDVLD